MNLTFNNNQIYVKFHFLLYRKTVQGPENLKRPRIFTLEEVWVQLGLPI